MRILTVRQPWAWAILHGGKTVENRPRNIAGSYRGPIAIHAGKTFDDTAWEDLVLGPMLEDALRRGDEIEFTPGAIIGIVDLVGVHRVIETNGRAHCEPVKPPQEACVSGACSSWAQRGSHHLLLENPRPLAEPIPYTGALGLRNLATRDPETVLTITRQIGPT